MKSKNDDGNETFSAIALKQVVVTESERLGMYSEAVVILMMMIAAHESGGFANTGDLAGAGRSLWKMNDDIHDEVLDYVRDQQPDVLRYLESINPDLDVTELETNLRYAVCICRLRLSLFTTPIPDADNLVGLSQFANTYWNSHLGIASPENYLQAYQQFC